jgi:hypothetical protein
MNKFKEIRLAHELDAAWIIALWLAIHDGDPSPVQIASEAIAALSSTFTSRDRGEISESSFAELQTRLKEIGVDFQTNTADSKAARSTESHVIRRYCVAFKGQTICIDLPNPFVWPPPR